VREAFPERQVLVGREPQLERRQGLVVEAAPEEQPAVHTPAEAEQEAVPAAGSLAVGQVLVGSHHQLEGADYSRPAGPQVVEPCAGSFVGWRKGRPCLGVLPGLPW